MSQESLWARLVESLDEWTAAAEVAPGRIEVALPPGGPRSRRVQIVMTPDEWDEMEGVMFGNFTDALEDVKRSLLRLGPGQDFAVYDQYRLEPSSESELAEALPPLPEPGGGEWVAFDRQGRAASRFRDFLESDAAE